MVEPKVTASTVGAALTAFVLWLLDNYVFVEANGQGAVPEQVEGVVQLLIVALVTFGAGYVRKHVHRPAAPGPVVPEVRNNG